MIATARVALWLALAVWVGAVVFLSFVVAPTIFRTLPSATAGQVMGALFPSYYAVGAVAGVVALAATLVLWRSGRAGAPLVVLVALMLGTTAYAGGVVQPRAAVLRPMLHTPDPAEGVREEFDRLHRLAVGLNAGVLLLGLASIVVAARAADEPRAR